MADSTSPDSTQDVGGNQVDKRSELAQRIAEQLNAVSRENISYSPDFILADYLLRCLEAYEAATIHRDVWYGFNPKDALTVSDLQPFDPEATDE